MERPTHGDSQREDGVPPAAAAEANEAARQAGAVAEEKARSFAADQKRAAAERIGGLASALRSTSTRMEGSDPLARPLQRAAEYIDDASRTLRDEDLDSLIERTEGFARQQPAAFLGASAALGFALGRFMRSSSERRRSRATSPGVAPSVNPSPSRGARQ